MKSNPASFESAVLVAWISLTFASTSQASTLFQHIGSIDPATEHWTVLGPGDSVSAGPILNDLGSSLDAWFVNDPSTARGSALQYRGFPTAGQAADALALGWTLSAELRVVNTPDDPGAGSVSVEYIDGSRRFGMNFGSQADGDPIVSLLGIFGGPTFALEGGGSGYHSYALRYDAALGSADLFVDGLERISDFAGIASPLGPEVAWGGRSSDDTGQGNYNSIRFDIGSVPDSGPTMLLLGMGVAILAGVRRGQSAAQA